MVVVSCVEQIKKQGRGISLSQSMHSVWGARFHNKPTHGTAKTEVATR